jgi:hypothetical protein
MRVAAWLIAAAAVSACASSPAPTAPDAEPSVEALRAAPAAVTLAGLRIDLQASAYRNVFPIVPPSGAPLVVIVRLPAAATAVTVDQLWLVRDDNAVWSGRPVQTPGATEWTVRDGPPWGPGISVDVVCRVRDGRGPTALVRAAAQPITAVS